MRHFLTIFTNKFFLMSTVALFLSSCSKNVDEDENNPILTATDEYVLVSASETTANSNYLSIEVRNGYGFIDLNNNQTRDKGEALNQNSKLTVTSSSGTFKIYGAFEIIETTGFDTVDITHFPSLQRFFGRNHKSLNLAHPTLKQVVIYQSDLKTVDIASCPNLDIAVFNDCQLEAIDFSKNPELEIAYAAGNKLTELDFTKNKKLKNANFQLNNISANNITSLINSLPTYPVSDEPAASCVVYGENYPNNPDGNVVLKSHVTTLKEKGWQVSKMVYINETNTGFEGFEGL